MSSSRLDAIINLVPKCNIVADIGTDHAYVPISLIKRGIVKRCIASDLRKGPLNIACNNIVSNNMEKVIETRLGPGLDILEKDDEVDCIVISGMGGTLIKNILDEGKEKLSPKTLIIAQPNKYQNDVREWFYNNNYNIYKEKLVLEGKRMYNIICAVVENGTTYDVDPFKYYVGDKLKRDPLYGLYIKNMLKKYKRALSAMDNMREKNSYLREKYEWLVEGLQSELNNFFKGDEF
ncbi:MAG: SAM-dependent methyltransferase [Clostridiales bacterium]|nr:SAM-dependent methyltransferase [Clostridiales bacterium]